MKKYEYAVVVGRFQPFHNHHKALVDRAIAIATRVIIVIGSSSEKRTAKNPFLVTERRRMIRDCYPHEKFNFYAAQDYPDSDAAWADQVRNMVDLLTGSSRSVALVANCKPGEDYIPRLLNFYHQEVTHHNHEGSGTEIRNLYFGRGMMTLETRVPWPVWEYLEAFEKSKYFEQAMDAYAGSDDDAA